MALLAITLMAGTAAVVIGEATRRRLNLLAYRRPDEAARPDPGPRWWVPVATAAAVIALTVRFLPTRPHLLWMLVPLALAGPWLGAVDLDVRRLPDRVLLPLLAWQALATAGLFITGHRDTGLAVVIGAVGCLIGLWSLHWFSDGAVGFGDVKLGAAVAAATSAVSLTVLFWALLGSFTAAAIWALLARRQDLALGPWLALGGIAVTIMAS